ncbi:MAG TPA: TonB-dependent receptor plug domain-containing protein, partial [Flavisolibacter sp.]
MKKAHLFCFILASICLSATGQNLVKGRLKANGYIDSLAGISVSVKNTTIGTVTDERGFFKVPVPNLPATLVITSVMFQPMEIKVNSLDAGEINLELSTLPGEEIVIAADRFGKKLMDVAVSIERFGHGQIRNAPVLSYNDLALYKKGVDMTTSSLTFKTISTRGFNGSGSTRVNQLVDGMDNQAPGLNFFVGNFVGLTELDVDNVEILPGASSALYGPGGMNGTILIKSKNPFDYQGLSVLLKEGLGNVDRSQRPEASSFHDFSLRYAKAINKKFAFKIGAQFIKGTDWLAGDTSNYLRTGSVGKLVPGNRMSDPNYD